MLRTILIAAATTFGAATMTMPVALAQSAEDCEAALTEVNADIDSLMDSQQPGSEEAATSARSMTEEAASARDEGNHARCVELVTDAKNVVEGATN